MNPANDQAILDRVRAYLRSAGIQIRELHHEPARTSEESAALRGEPLEVGAKALVMKADDEFLLVVLSAARKVESGRLRQQLNARKLRFATKEELFEQTGLVPGAVPPFGAPILPYRLVVDRSIEALDRVAFNAGSLTDSIMMARDDYLRAANPQAIVDVAT